VPKHDDTSPRPDVVALFEALERMDSPARMILAEELLDLLAQDFPLAARAAGVLLAKASSADGRRLGLEVLRRLNQSPEASLRQEIAHALSEANADVGPVQVDVLLLTIKDVEQIACLRAFGIPSGVEPVPLTGGAEAYLCTHDGVRYAIGLVGTDGGTESALGLGRLLLGVKTGLAILVGMAAGVRGPVHVGDVVVAEEVWAVDFEVLKADGPHSPRPKTYRPTSSIAVHLPTFRNMDPTWAHRVSQEVRDWAARDPLCEIPEDMDEDWKPAWKPGVIFAGSRLVEDGSLPGRRRDEHARLLAAEMEGHGFAAACHFGRERLDWLVFRGVADYGEPERVKDWQFAATYAAAALVRDAIARGRIDVRPPRT